MIMERIRVNASKEYDCIIEENALSQTGKYAKECSLWGKACIITDTNVAPLYKETVKKSLLEEGFWVTEYVFSAGEKSKNAQTYLDILNFLAENHFSRTDTLFALGGGVCGDLTGFCAATYMRGINFVQLPTSLLASVDSSVGGKTAIDLECGKNLAGAFYQPKFVLFDPTVLKTLPEEYIKDGIGEIIKYAMIKKGSLETLLDDFYGNIEEIISECIKIKRDIVAEDEFEGGIRKLLNFGHTAGHAIEKAADFTLSHGRCVAKGMYIVTNAWEKRGLCEKGTCERLIKMLEKFSLDIKTDFAPSILCEIARSDKKADAKGLSLVVPRNVGECSVIKVSIEELLDIFKEGME